MQNPSMPTSLLILDGPDAAAFAQAQFSSDVSGLATGQWQWSAWLDAKGRCRAFLQLARPATDRFTALLRGGDAAAMAEDLRRFVFRSKVGIAATDDMTVIDGPALHDGLITVDEDEGITYGGGIRSWRIVNATSKNANEHATRDWIEHDIDAGFAWLPDAAIGELLPQSLSFERLGAVSFNKGCFPGQEIVARMHYRGAGKQRLHTASFNVIASPGATLRRNNAAAGMVLNTHVVDGASKALVILNDAGLGDERAGIFDVQGIDANLASLHTWPH
jgi:folate-binding protein YgfZ